MSAIGDCALLFVVVSVMAEAVQRTALFAHVPGENICPSNKIGYRGNPQESSKKAALRRNEGDPASLGGDFTGKSYFSRFQLHACSVSLPASTQILKRCDSVRDASYSIQPH